MNQLMKYSLVETIKNGLCNTLHFYISTKMADTKMTIMENIFREMITVIGYEKALEIVTNFKPKTEEKPKPVPKKEEEKKKRIPRMSPTLTVQLKTELGKVGLKYPEEDKKEFEKIKKEFVAYVDDLTDDDFTDKSITDHMRDFANTKKPAPAEEKADVKIVTIEEKPKKGGKKKEEVVKKDDPPAKPASVQELSLSDLQKIEMLAVPSGDENVGIYWDAEKGRWVRGPDAVEDEDLEEMGFKMKSYMVGVKSGRIYVESETGGADTFVGFVGVGKFREMKMP